MPCNDLCLKRCAGPRLVASKQLRRRNVHASGCERRRLEDTLDMRTSELIALRKAAVEHSAVSPVKSAQLALALGAWATGGGSGCA